MNKSLLSALAAGTLLLAASGAQAQWSVGASGGWTRGDYDCGHYSSCDRTSTGYKLYGGYNFGSQLVLEGIYFHWGHARATGTMSDSQGGTGEAVYEVKSTGWGLGGAYILPLSPEAYSLFRAGLVYNQGETTATLGSVRGSESFSMTYPYLGAALAFQVTPNTAFTVEADLSRIQFLDEDQANVGLLSVGLRIRF